jgi:hypothetical protein
MPEILKAVFVMYLLEEEKVESLLERYHSRRVTRTTGAMWMTMCFMLVD